MRKKLCFLMSILFLFGICVTAKAGTPIADRQYNFSWEYDANGETEICHTGDMDYSLAWEDNGRDWSGVDVNCDHEASDCDECKDWFIVPDGNVVAFVNGGSAAFRSDYARHRRFPQHRRGPLGDLEMGESQRPAAGFDEL